METQNDSDPQAAPSEDSPAVPRPEPPGWRRHCLSIYLSDFHENAYHIFLKKRDIFELMNDLFEGYLEFRTCPDAHKDLFGMSFLPRSLSSYLAAVRLAMYGLPAEAHMCARGCLENALYGFRIGASENPVEMMNVYLSRHKSSEARRCQKRAFRYGKTLEMLKAQDPSLAGDISQTYEWLIDWGAHPNPMAHMISTDITRCEDKLTILSNIGAKDWNTVGACLHVVADAGLCSLRAFQHTLKDGEDKSAIGAMIVRLVQRLSVIQW